PEGDEPGGAADRPGRRALRVRRGRATIYGGGGDTGGTAPNGYPYCANSSSDPDGDGWGWENSRSCVVRGSSADH
ncbi:carbohydrate-binding domain-containing protein, partial [Streptomyces hydrogenans]|uniref:carbohydrate-binding domain-containing protein n=1 Tax=Streptomyces hydrogenans TaxID=1873719 RepID=UPI0035D8D10E